MFNGCRHPGLVWVGLVRLVACCSILRTPARAAATFTGHVVTWTPAPGDDDGAWRSHGTSPGHVRTADDAEPGAAFRRGLNGTCTGHSRSMIDVRSIGDRPSPTDRPTSRLLYLCIPMRAHVTILESYTVAFFLLSSPSNISSTVPVIKHCTAEATLPNKFAYR